MIIESIKDMPACDSQVVELWPTSKTTFEGTLSAGGHDYSVVVTYEEKQRLWARVKIQRSIDDDDQIERAALEVARRGIKDPLWRPLCVDPNDGETLYGTTFTCDMSTDALDRFLVQAKEFLEKNQEDLDRLLSSNDDAGGNDSDMSELLDHLFG